MEAHVDLKVWPSVNAADYDQIIFDLRTDEQKEASRKCEKTHTFKLEYDIWDE